MSRLAHVTKAEPLGGYRLHLEFDDGLAGEIDLEGDLWGPVFDAVRDPAVFVRVRVDPELGTIVWPTGADLDPCALHDRILASRGVDSAT